MRSSVVLSSVLALVQLRGVAAHATFQQLWVNGKDQGTVCARLPTSNNPVTSVASNDIRCNINSGPASSKCSVSAGSTVTVEMHQQPNDRSCANEAIGGAHYGPVLVYLSKVSDASTADGSAPFFKIFEDTWGKKSATSQGSDDYWGTKDLNTNCGKMDVKLPSDLAPGDYLLRAEAIALHSSASAGGAQFYITCFQITVTGGGSNSPAGVAFPGAYKAADPGIQINIYQQLSTYVPPGPSVIAGGVVAVAGKIGTVATATGGASQPSATAVPATTTKAAVPATSSITQVVQVPSTLATSAKPATSSAAAGACPAVAKWAQCGGSDFKGCSSTCEAGSSCKVLNTYYSQCQ
ncbi:carbohydrate-binding module family 1 protein [Amniculicola lignicola CBS 123094]|uniref:AA9 family lytic polysaccharide monooxygenase n=1 Tax=Amniculicola lignicola CBS 123094 TaxID=1392246 RepID=A0A6A5W500_9PLEO|nr:carbohydrate-binding module family 1 protein [Amniculicola lignicola CBS 123094]